MKKSFKKIFAILCVVMMMATLGVTFFASATSAGTSDTADIAVSAMKEGLSEVTSTLSINNILTVIVALIGACIVLVFFWWGLRKLIRAVMSAFKKGKLSV